jgi:hypothetical protein
MTYQRRALRHLGLAGLAAALLALAPAGPATAVPTAQTTPAPEAAAQPDRAALVRDWFDARTRGDVPAVLAMLTDAVVFTGVLHCPLEDPCTGDRVRGHVLDTAATQNHYTTTELATFGSLVAGRVETRGELYCDAGVERIVFVILIQIPQDRIDAYVGLLDLSDPQTTAFGAVLFNAAPPGPRPPAC